MKAIILAAGRGERLKAVNSLPKPMIMIKGRPILEHNVLLFKKYGIRDIWINLHHLPQVIAGYFRDGRQFGVNIKYSHEQTLLGTAGAVKKIWKDCWDCDRKGPFLVAYGDNLFPYRIDEMMGFQAKKKGSAVIAVYEKQGDLSQSGVISIDNDSRITRFIEKPRSKVTSSGFVNAGLYVLEPDVPDFIQEKGFSDFGANVFPEMLKYGKVIHAFRADKTADGHAENLVAVDTPELLKEAMRLK
ncbi:MAG: nucleotidyltransferase family protein [Deltaproteobacteria bacterium]